MKDAEILERYKIQLTEKATDGSMPNQDYVDARNFIRNHPLLLETIPNFINSCHNADEFRSFMQEIHSTYKVRRSYLAEVFNPLIEILVNGSVQPFSSLKNDYEEVCMLGQGGFGCVYQYRNKLLEYDFAVKYFAPSFPIDEESDMIRFFQEAKILFELNHPNIIKIYDIGISSGKPFIRMEYFKGKNLNQTLIDHGTLSASKASDLILNVSEAMLHAHEKVVHRDLKPSNIMVAYPNKFRVIDFGLGIYKEKQITSRITKHSEKASDSLYTAPELHDNPKLIDKRSDIYSVGAIWYTMLVGSAPSGIKIKEKILAVKDVTEGYANIIIKCLEDIEDRYNDFSEVISDIRQI